MPSLSSEPKVAYIYDQESDTWHPVAGNASTTANYDWTGDHQFESEVTFLDVVVAEGGINNFQFPSSRDAAIPTPANGTVVFVRQDALGNAINQIQYYANGSWINYKGVVVEEKTATYTIQDHDANKLIKMNSSSDLEVLIPAALASGLRIGTKIEVVRMGTGKVTISTQTGSGVTVRAVDNIKEVPYQYGYATLTQIALNEWLVVMSSLTLPPAPPFFPPFFPPYFPGFVAPYFPTFQPEPPYFPSFGGTFGL